MNRYLIIPDCSDYNRGDQALIWETIRIAKDAGFQGEYYMQSDGVDCTQSAKEGIKVFHPILPHPSRGGAENNVNYKGVLLKWGARALKDLFCSLWVLLICKKRSLCHAFLGKEKNDSLDLFRDSSAVFVKGGGFIHSFGGPTAFYFIYYHLYTINLAHAMGLPVYIMPNSFGPIDGFLCKWQVRKALSRCRLVYCREHISHEYMTKTFPSLSFRNSFDLGLYLNRDDAGVSYDMPDKKIRVAITVRPYRFPEHNNGDDLYRSYIASMRGFARWLIEKGYHPVFVQHTLSQNAHEDDMQAIRDILTDLPDYQYGLFADSSYNCRQMKSLYSHFDYIVGTRFHSVVFSMMEGVPAIAIAYGGNKTRGIMQDMGLGEYVIGIDEVTVDSIVSLFSGLVANRETVKIRLQELKGAVDEERRKIVDCLKEKGK